MKYSEQLLTEEWKNKRLEILKRDNFCCTKCDKKRKLHVHHKKYIRGRMAWEYSNKYLTTLCESCHAEIHNKKPIFKFKEKKKSEKKKPDSRIKKMYKSMSKKDLAIQKLYDKRK